MKNIPNSAIDLLGKKLTKKELLTVQSLVHNAHEMGSNEASEVIRLLNNKILELLQHIAVIEKAIKVKSNGL